MRERPEKGGKGEGNAGQVGGEKNIEQVGKENSDVERTKEEKKGKGKKGIGGQFEYILAGMYSIYVYIYIL